jgi:thioredoxin reductase (NADPH)
MLAALEALLRSELSPGQECEIEVLDVDADPVLEARYDELVPVLEAEDVELCHYHLDAPKVREYLDRFR